MAAARREGYPLARPGSGKLAEERTFRRCAEIYRRARDASYCRRRIRGRQQRIGT